MSKNLKKSDEYYRKKALIGTTVLNRLRKTGNILTGARALNRCFPSHLDRYTSDFDVISPTPKKSARAMERDLDKRFGGNFFKTEQAVHPGTWKIRSIINQEGIVDFTKEKVPSRIDMDNVRVAKLSHMRKKARESLRNPKAKFRHRQDKETLKKIAIYNKYYKSKW